MTNHWGRFRLLCGLHPPLYIFRSCQRRCHAFIGWTKRNDNSCRNERPASCTNVHARMLDGISVDWFDRSTSWWQRYRMAYNRRLQNACVWQWTNMTLRRTSPQTSKSTSTRNARDLGIAWCVVESKMTLPNSLLPQRRTRPDLHRTF